MGDLTGVPGNGQSSKYQLALMCDGADDRSVSVVPEASSEFEVSFL